MQHDFDDIMVRFLQLISAAILFHIVIVVALLLSGCTTVRTVETVRTEYIRSADTLHTTDSVFIYHADTFIIGDTVKVISYRMRDRLHTEYRLRMDTIMRADTIRVPTVTERQLSAWQRIRLQLFWPLVIAIIIIVGGCIIKKRFFNAS